MRITAWMPSSPPTEKYLAGKAPMLSYGSEYDTSTTILGNRPPLGSTAPGLGWPAPASMSSDPSGASLVVASM
eukprot:gene11971-8546_t